MKRSSAARLPPLSALRAFEAVARLGTVKEAAEELALTPSAVSHQLRNLEVSLAVALFQRRSQFIGLTAAGARLAGYAQRGFRELREGVIALRSDSGASVLRVSVTPLFATEFIAPHLAEFERQHPHMQLQLEATQSLADFGADPIDAAIRMGPEPPPPMYSEVVLDVVITLVCCPSLLESASPLRMLDDLRAQVLISYTEPHVDPDGWRRWTIAAGRPDLSPARELHFDTFGAALHAAEAGVGVLIAPYPIVLRHIAQRRLAAPFNVYGDSPWRYRFVCRRGEECLPKIDSFRRWIARVIARGPGPQEAEPRRGVRPHP